MYRKVEAKTWGDERVCRLSAAPPNGQTLWLRLLTGPELTQLPGLISAGRLALAEALGWDAEGFDKAFGEVLREGLALADWKARVILVPNAVRHNPPESPNVIKGWRRHYDLVTDCDLKLDRWPTIVRQHIEIKASKAFTEAFREAFPEAFEEGRRKPLPKILKTLPESGTGTGTGTGTEEKSIAAIPPKAAEPAEPPPKPKLKRSRFCPDDFELTPKLRQYATDHGLDDLAIDAEWKQFKLHEYNAPKLDWSRSWQSWVLKAVQIRANRPASLQPRFAGEQTIANVRALLAKGESK